jgi:serine phosphatase RsbU (regulator of sigma subunit)
VLDFPYFPSGNYTISIRAKDILGNTSETISLSFEIKPPFWQTLWFYAICVIFILLLFILTVKLRERNLKREKEILEQKVKERTKTIEEQKEVLKNQRDDLARYNEEILQQKEEIEAQRDEIEIQRDQIFKQNDEITKSITYARRIQSAVMPSNEMIKSLVGNYFLLFRPRDIVSGDFYWMAERNGKVLVAVSDCTGHGVPGAFMSMMGVSFLNDIVNVAGVTKPDLILNELRHKIKSNFRQSFGDNETRDGMDIAICSFDAQTKKVQFSGAYNPMLLIRKGDLTEFKGDKMPVGTHIKEVKFTLHEIDIKSGDNIYIFSDGYVDQFGGDDGKKFMAKPFKELLVSVNGNPMPEQKKILEDTLDKWQGAHDQVDDILVMGISID